MPPPPCPSSSAVDDTAAPPASLHARCDAFWQWPSLDERRLWSPAPRCRPFASARANALALLAARAVLFLFVAAAAAQSAWFFTLNQPSEHYIAFLSNQGQWIIVVVLAIELLLTAAAVASVERRDSGGAALRALLLSLPPHSAAATAATAAAAAAAGDTTPPATPAAPPSLPWLFALGWKRATLLLLEIGAAFDVVIVALFWLLLRQYVGSGSVAFWHAIFTHGVVLGVLTIDLLLLSANRFVPRHVLAVIASGLAYAAINAGYTFIAGAPLYPFLTWRGGATAVVFFGVLALLSASFFACSGLALARDTGCGCAGPVAAAAAPAPPAFAVNVAGASSDAEAGRTKESAVVAVAGSAEGAADAEEERWRAMFPTTFDDEAAAARPCGCCAVGLCCACCTNVNSPRHGAAGAAGAAAAAPLLGRM
jgi:hypothetical protein